MPRKQAKKPLLPESKLRTSNNRVLTNAEIADAIRSSMGLMTVAARKLNTSYSNLTKLTRDRPDLATLRAEMDEAILDLAEGALFQRIQKGSDSAIQFLLRTKGRKRGYREEDESKGSNEALEAIVKAIQEARDKE